MSEPFDRVAPTTAPLDGRWRAEAANAQEQAVPRGTVTVSCSAPFGVGGLGRHCKEIVEALNRSAQPTACISGSTRESGSENARRAPRHMLGLPYLTKLLSASPLPTSPGLTARAFMSEFDAYAAQSLPSATHLIAFNGQAIAQFRAAARAGYSSLGLVSANSHLRHLLRQHARAHRRYPLEGSWASHLLKRNLAEYAQADRIYVASAYTRDSFLDQGFDAEKLEPFPFTPDPRYRPTGEPRASATFNIVYIGSLSVVKGVPLLIDAVRRLPHDDLRLRLVGGWGTRGMRRFIEGACAGDSRISVSPGDPLPHLNAASLCVHPSYEDGFGYAPAEALACGVPVLVSEDTGMKDLIGSADAGVILPTGDLEALTSAIEAAYRREVLSG